MGRQLVDKQSDISLFYDLSRTEYRLRVGIITLKLSVQQMEAICKFYEVLERERRFAK